MTEQTASTVADVGITVNLAAGHVGEMAGQAMQAAAKAVEAMGKAWADTAVRVGTRDAKRFNRKQS